MERIEQINYIKAPATLVYEALTTEEGLGHVWTNKLKVKPETGFINEFDFNEGYLTKMKIIELQENDKVVWECIASDEEWVGTGISFDLSEKNNVTTVVLRHYNWRELTDYYRWCSYNWAMFLYRLKGYCENEITSAYQENKT
ncbi:SRPBCC family protein [Sphingobacterium haloxyli]|uniref:ATPase n=1 Tax=Sphingobacterium haloxyli TaxID=2100533 RepID=A0A2S9J4X0_9SPHI|nr:SRPBCC domain-containing protein [Sphingobacterium haloxyli]PRD47802.1 ATPase [Sphingobacterium haloxyli]